MKLAILFCSLASAFCVYGADPCGPRNPCLNSGTCSAAGRDYKCDCQPGWTGRQCSVPQRIRRKDTCRPSHFRCRSVNRCVPEREVCDKKNSCGDDSDEQVCSGPRECGSISGLPAGLAFHEGTRPNVSVTLCGRASPTVVWTFVDSTTQSDAQGMCREVGTNSLPYKCRLPVGSNDMYRYTFRLPYLKRSFCGQPVKFRASGYGDVITGQEKITVKFVPPPVRDIEGYAKISSEKICVTQISWLATEVYSCDVQYRMEAYDETAIAFSSAQVGTFRSNWCVEPRPGRTNVTHVRVQAQMGDMFGLWSNLTELSFSDPPADPAAECKDKSEHCTYWASTNQCEVNSGYMKDNCCESCKKKPGSTNTCTPNPCLFLDTVEQQSIESGECSVVGGSIKCSCKPSYEGERCEKIRPIEMFAGPGMEHLLSVKMSVDTFKDKFSGGGDNSGSSKFKSYRKDPNGLMDQIGCGTVGPVPSDLTFITRYRHYRKYTHAFGIPIVSTNAVSNKALDRACYVLRFLLTDHPRVRKYLFYNWGRVGIMGRREGTTSIPEHRHLGKWWDTRARGLGGTLHIPISTGAEENLLCERGDRYPNEDIFLHEFCHGIQEVGIRGGGIPGYFGRLQRQYNYARSRGLWRNTYAMSTVQEYFAEGVQSYFHTNDYSPTPNGVHGPINTRAKLKRYDPALYNLIHEVFPCENWITTNCQEAKGMARKMPKPGCGGLTKPKPKTPPPPKRTQGPPPTPQFTDPPTGGPPPRPKSPPPPKPKSPPPPKPKSPPPPKPKSPPPPKPKPKPNTPPPKPKPKPPTQKPKPKPATQKPKPKPPTQKPKPKPPTQKPKPKPPTPKPKPKPPTQKPKPKPPTQKPKPKPPTQKPKPKPPTQKGCDKDEEADCPAWAGMGYCLKSSLLGKDFHHFMHDKCRKSCGCCDDKSSVCANYKGYCGERMSYYMERLCKKTCSYCDS